MPDRVTLDKYLTYLSTTLVNLLSVKTTTLTKPFVVVFVVVVFYTSQISTCYGSLVSSLPVVFRVAFCLCIVVLGLSLNFTFRASPQFSR